MAINFLSSNRVRVNRLKAGFTQAQLAERAGVSRSAVTAIESNRLVPSVTAAIGIAKALRQSVEDLFGFNSSAPAESVWESKPLLGRSRICSWICSTVSSGKEVMMATSRKWLDFPFSVSLSQRSRLRISTKIKPIVLTLSKPYDIKATGYMPYQFDVVETELTEDKWVTAYEILPSERDVVHHVIVKVHEKGSAARDAGEGAGGYWAVYVPGNGSQKYNQGFARLLPAGSKVSFQIHYTPSGTAKKERLRMGLVFAKDKPQYEVRTVGVAHLGISIPPHTAAHVEAKTQRVPLSEVLLDIPRYDFNWQLNYAYKAPKLVPRGSTIKVTAVYNNSESNAANPDPGKRVKWGPQTIDEMMIGYVEYFVPLTEPKVAAK